MSRSPSFSLLNMLLVHFLVIRYNLVYMIALLYKYASVSCEMGNCGARLRRTRVKGEAVNLYLPVPSHTHCIYLFVFHVYANIFLLPSSRGLSLQVQISMEGCRLAFR